MLSSLYKLRQKAFRRQEGHCYYCEYPMWLESWEEFAASFGISKAAAFHFRCTAEHLVARQDGGKDSPKNIVAACRFCNYDKTSLSNAARSRNISKACYATSSLWKMASQRASPFICFVEGNK